MRGAGREGPVWRRPERTRGGSREVHSVTRPNWAVVRTTPGRSPGHLGTNQISRGKPRGEREGELGCSDLDPQQADQDTILQRSKGRRLCSENADAGSQTCRGTRGSQPRPPGEWGDDARVQALRHGGRIGQNNPKGWAAGSQERLLLTRGPRKWGWGLNSRTDGGEKTAAIVDLVDLV